MISNKEIQSYAVQLAKVLAGISELQENAKDIVGSAKDAGVNVSALRKVAREMNMETDKRHKLYEAENQLDMFRSAVGIRYARVQEAAE